MICEYFLLVGALASIRGMLFYMLPANNHHWLGFKLNLTETTLEFTRLENKGIKSCGLSAPENVFCSNQIRSPNLNHVGEKVQVIPYYERKIGRTSTYSTFIG